MCTVILELHEHACLLIALPGLPMPTLTRGTIFFVIAWFHSGTFRIEVKSILNGFHQDSNGVFVLLVTIILLPSKSVTMNLQYNMISFAAYCIIVFVLKRLPIGYFSVHLLNIAMP